MWWKRKPSPPWPSWWGCTRSRSTSSRRWRPTSSGLASGTMAWTAAGENSRPITDAGPMTARAAGGEPVQPRVEQRLDRGRKLELRDVRGRQPAVSRAAQVTVGDEHGEQLAHEQRIAVGRLDDPCRHAGVQHAVAERVADDLLERRRAEGLQGQMLRARRIRPVGAVAERLARGPDEEQWHGRGVDDMAHELEQRRLRPVQILEDDSDRAPSGRRLEQLAGTPEQLAEWELHGAGQPHRCDDAIGDRRVADERGELAVDLGRVVAVLDRRGLARDVHKRPERDAASVRQAPAAQQARPP